MNNSLLIFNFIICGLGCVLSLYTLYNKKIVTIHFHRCVYLALMGIIFGLWGTFGFLFSEHLRFENTFCRALTFIALVVSIQGMKYSDNLIKQYYNK